MPSEREAEGRCIRSRQYACPSCSRSGQIVHYAKRSRKGLCAGSDAAGHWRPYPLYGTVVYFFQFFHAGRHVGHTRKDLLIFVGTSNGMWFVFPLWGIWLCWKLIESNSYAIFH